MDAAELRGSVIHIVCAGTQREVDDVDAVYLADILIALATADILCDQFGDTEEHALEIGELIVVLYLEQQQTALGILGQNVHPIVFVVLVLLIAFTLKQLANGDLLVQQCGQQPFYHGKVCLVAQEAFHRPVKSDIICHTCLVLWIQMQK